MHSNILIIDSETHNNRSLGAVTHGNGINLVIEGNRIAYMPV